MARFDVYKIRTGELVVDCQSDILSHLNSRFVIPLRPDNEIAIGIQRLNPRFEFQGLGLIMATQLARAIDKHDITGTVGSISNRQDEIMSAIDILLTGV